MRGDPQVRYWRAAPPKQGSSLGTEWSVTPLCALSWRMINWDQNSGFCLTPDDFTEGEEWREWGWVNERMKGLLNHGCALCVNVQTKGAHRQCLCDLKGRTHNVCSVPIISILYMVQRLTVGCCLTGLAPTSCHGQRLIATVKLYVPIHPVGHYDRGRAFIIFHVIMPRHELQTRSSDSMGRSCRTEPHSGPFLELQCLWHVFSYLV